jgi:DNA polymerase-1
MIEDMSFEEMINPFADPAPDPFAAPPASAAEMAPDVPEIDLSGPIGIDLETASADEAFTYEGAFVRLAGVIDQHDTTRTGVPLDELVDMIEAAPEVYGHNILGFDGPVLAHRHGMDWEAFAAKAVDTEPLARQAHPPRSRGKSSVDEYDLDHVAERYGLPGKTDDIKGLARRYGGFDLIPSDDPDYNAYLDGDLRASKAVREILPSDPYTAREHEILGLMGRMTINGFKVDVPLLRERQRQGEEKKAAALVELSSGYGLPLSREVMRGRGKAKAPVTERFSSPLATKEGNAWLTDLWKQHGVVQPPRTGKGALSTAAEELKKIAEHPRCPADLRNALELMGIVTTTRTVYQTALTYLTADGRVHPKVSMRQASGRGSVTQPGMTVFGKRNGKHVERDIFVADEGHVIITCDLSQVDMRAVAGHCQDPLYMSLYEPGKDAHQEIADMMGVTRDAAKPLGHGYNYGMGAKAMIRDGHDPQLVATFFDVMSRFTVKDTWTGEVRDIAGRGEVLDNGFGRLMRCDPTWAYTVAPALMGQGGARDITCEVLLRLMRKHPEYRPFLRTWVHDEYVFSVPEDQAEEIGAEIKEAFTWEWRGVPILCDLSKPGASWGAVSAK